MNYSTVNAHRTMITDERRNAFYAAALKAHVHPHSVILDLGAGLGILGMIAAGFGAQHVYLVEPQPVIHLGRKIAADNGLLGRISAIEGVIEEVTLPQTADIIVSVFTGNFLFTEDLLPSLFLARDRYLKSGGVLIPDSGQIVAAPVSAPQLYQEKVLAWHTPQQGLQFKRAHRFAVNSLHYLRADQGQVDFLADQKSLMTVDFYEAQEANCKGTADFTIRQSGTCHGLLGWMRLGFEDTLYSTGPDHAPSHWKQVYFPIEPLTVEEGEKMRLGITRPQGGQWTWRVQTSDSQRVHSTFYSQIVTKEKIKKGEVQNRPMLNDQGQALKLLLEQFDGQNSIEEIAAVLCRAFPALFTETSSAIRFIRQQIADYTSSEQS